MNTATVFRVAALVTASLAIATPAIFAKGKPAPAPTSFVPEIGYVQSTAAGSDVRLANRAGTQAVLIARTTFQFAPSFDLSHRSARLIAYSSGGKLFLRSWQSSGSGFTLGPEELLFEVGSSWINTVDFSPDGTKILFSSVHPDRRLRTIDLTAAGRPVTSDIEFYGIIDARWSKDGTRIFAHASPGGEADYSIYVIDPSSGSYELFAPPPPLLTRFDILRTTQSTELLGDLDGRSIYRVSSSGALTYLSPGREVSPSCDDSQMIHILETKRGTSVVISALTPGAPKETWSTDKSIRKPGWMPGCPS